MAASGSSSAAAGLGSTEARRRLTRHGPNALPVAPSTPGWRRFVRQFESPLVLLLVFALAFDLATWLVRGAAGFPTSALVIAAVLLLNAGLALLQERRSEQALARLHLSIAAGAALTVAAALAPDLRHALGLAPLEAKLWLGVLGTVAVTWLGAEAIGRAVDPRRHGGGDVLRDVEGDVETREGLRPS